MNAGVRFVLRRREVERLLADRRVATLLLLVGQRVVQRAKARAPRRTGAGAASIREDAVLAGREWQVHIAWDQLRFYMYFQHEGTAQIEPRPFLVDAVREAAL